jgi:hypothetical protein
LTAGGVGFRDVVDKVAKRKNHFIAPVGIRIKIIQLIA